MITEEEKKAALFAISFNRYKILKMFAFCFVSFCVGLSVLYHNLESKHEIVLNKAYDMMFDELQLRAEHHELKPIASLYEGVVSFNGLYDNDHAIPVALKDEENEAGGAFYQVRGQRRQVANGIYELRFVKVGLISSE